MLYCVGQSPPGNGLGEAPHQGGYNTVMPGPLTNRPERQPNTSSYFLPDVNGPVMAVLPPMAGRVFILLFSVGLTWTRPA